MYILANGGNIYYSDTYSIVSNIKLPYYMVNSNEIGKLKLEYVIDKAIFIWGKTYCFVTEEGDFVNKAKGVAFSSLDWEGYLKLLNKSDITAIKKQSKKFYTRGYIADYIIKYSQYKGWQV